MRSLTSQTSELPFTYEVITQGKSVYVRLQLSKDSRGRRRAVADGLNAHQKRGLKPFSYFWQAESKRDGVHVKMKRSPRCSRDNLEASAAKMIAQMAKAIDSALTRYEQNGHTQKNEWSGAAVRLPNLGKRRKPAWGAFPI